MLQDLLTLEHGRIVGSMSIVWFVLQSTTDSSPELLLLDTVHLWQLAGMLQYTFFPLQGRQEGKACGHGLACVTVYFLLFGFNFPFWGDLTSLPIILCTDSPSLGRMAVPTLLLVPVWTDEC